MILSDFLIGAVWTWTVFYGSRLPDRAHIRRSAAGFVMMVAVVALVVGVIRVTADRAFDQVADAYRAVTEIADGFADGFSDALTPEPTRPPHCLEQSWRTGCD